MVRALLVDPDPIPQPAEPAEEMPEVAPTAEG
jgi:hypothetical protein